MRVALIVAAICLSAPDWADKSISQSADGSVTQRLDERDLARARPIIPRPTAEKIALARVPGKIVAAEIETNDGVRNWQIDVHARKGRLHGFGLTLTREPSFAQLIELADC